MESILLHFGLLVALLTPQSLLFGNVNREKFILLQIPRLL
uniref:Uncharacterized protein n=1 Tax=Arundo donax TaxID=35708 RepID=A0A0A9BGN6_ARUDO